MKEKMTSCPVCGSPLKQDFCPRCLYLPPLPKPKKGDERDLKEILKTGDTMIGHFYLMEFIVSEEGSEDSLSEFGKTVQRRFEKQEERLLQIVVAFENSDVIDIGRFDNPQNNSRNTADLPEKDSHFSSDRTEKEQREYSPEFEKQPVITDNPEKEVSVSDFDIMASLIAEDPEEGNFSDSFISGLLGEAVGEPYTDEDSWGKDQVVEHSENTRVTDCITDVLDEEGNIVSPVGERERDLFSDRNHPVRIEREDALRRERRERQLRSGLQDDYSEGQTQPYENYASGMVRPGIFSSPEFTLSDDFEDFSGMTSENQRDFIYSEMLEVDSQNEGFFESDRKESDDKAKKEKVGLFGKRKSDQVRRRRGIQEDNYSFIDKDVDSYYLDKDMPEDLDERLDKKKMSGEQMKQAAIFGFVAMLGVGMMVVPFI